MLSSPFYNEDQWSLTFQTLLNFCQVTEELGLDYNAFSRSLNLTGMLGLEQHYGRDVSIMYTTGYTCKGTKSTDEWLGMLGQIQDKLVEEDASKYTLKDVVGKFMYKVTSLTQKPKEETVFALSGGKISYNSVTTKSCSVNKVHIP
jgi:hypothetical protein